MVLKTIVNMIQRENRVLFSEQNYFLYIGPIYTPIGLCREPSSRPQDGSLRSRTGGFVDTRPRAVVGKQDSLMPVLGRAA